MAENAVKFAEDFMKKYPRADLYSFRSWCYPQGFVLWGFIRLYEKTNRADFYDYVMQYCDEHVREDGEIAGYTGCSLDDIMATSVVVWAYSVTGEKKYGLAAKKVRKTFDTYPRNPDGGFWHGKSLDGEMWVDGLFMGLMFLTRYGKYVDDQEWCFDESIHQLNTVFARCRKDHTGLLYHAYSEGAKAPWANRITGCASEVWSEGLGWYAMILAEVSALIPEDYPGRESVIVQLKQLCDDLLKVQDDGCGLWYQVVDKPGAPRNFHDTSGSAMFLYTIKKAMCLGIVGGADYDRATEKAYRGILSKCVQGMDGRYHVLDACNGLPVQMYYDNYVDFAKTVDAQEAVAAVLWALTIMEEGCSGL